MPPASLICWEASLAAATIVLPAETNDPDSAATTPILSSWSCAWAAFGESAASAAAVMNANKFRFFMRIPKVYGDKVDCRMALRSRRFPNPTLKEEDGGLNR